MKIFSCLLISLCVLLAQSSLAQTVKLLIDIEPGQKDSGVLYLTPTQNKAFFVAGNSQYGGELWVTDGTKNGTKMVTDLTKGPLSSKYIHIIAAARKGVFFAFDDGEHGRELYWSDGTEKGTYLLADINAGKSHSLWGCSQGATLNDILYFIANDGVHGGELWKTDGTPEGTLLVKDINPGPIGAFKDECASLKVVNGAILFVATNGKSGYELWRSDGTATGTVLLKDINKSQQKTNIAEILEPVSSRNNQPTFQIKSVSSGVNGSDPQQLTLAKDLLYFTADDSLHGREVWRTDGTLIGTFMLKDVLVGPKSSNPQSLILDQDKLYFEADSSGNWGGSKFQSDGSTEHTKPIKEYIIGNKHLLEEKDRYRLNNSIFYQQYVKLDSLAEGYALFKSDGSPEHTGLVKAYTNSRIYPKSPRILGAVRGIVYFAAYTPLNGEELWRTDGSDQGTFMVQDISPDESSSKPWYLTEVNGHWLFTAENKEYGREIWEIIF